jgi:hypothetical protein
VIATARPRNDPRFSVFAGLGGFDGPAR